MRQSPVQPVASPVHREDHPLSVFARPPPRIVDRTERWVRPRASEAGCTSEAARIILFQSLVDPVHDPEGVAPHARCGVDETVKSEITTFQHPVTPIHESWIGQRAASARRRPPRERIRLEISRVSGSASVPSCLRGLYASPRPF